MTSDNRELVYIGVQNNLSVSYTSYVLICSVLSAPYTYELNWIYLRFFGIYDSGLVDMLIITD